MRNDRNPKIAPRLAALFALFAASSVDAANEQLFPRPASLQPAIEFWTRVYSEVDSGAGYVHDSRNLGVVYGTLHFNWYDSPQVQDQRIEKALQRYRQALLSLADGKREDLNKDERSALAPWGATATGESLRAAAANLRFQRGQADRFRDGIIRAGAWEGYIQDTLQALNLPAELAALPHVESSYNPLVRSAAGAAGLWQLTRFTGGHYLRVDHVVDERLDPLISTRAAAQLLKQEHAVLKSWPLAITAYNHGLPGVRRAVRETGSRDIGDIVQEYTGPRFGFASRNFYAAFLAAVDVARDQEQYFGVLERQGPGEHWTVKLPAYIPLSALTERLEMDADSLKVLNPPLRRAVWNGSKHLPKGYHLRLPVETGSKDVTALVKRVAVAEGRATQIPDVVYTVKYGDTLSHIAQRHNTSVRDLMETNNLRSRNQIRAGQSLRLSRALAPAGFASVELVVDDSESAPFSGSGASPGDRDAVETVGEARVVAPGGECTANC